MKSKVPYALVVAFVFLSVYLVARPAPEVKTFEKEYREVVVKNDSLLAKLGRDSVAIEQLKTVRAAGVKIAQAAAKDEQVTVAQIKAVAGDSVAVVAKVDTLVAQMEKERKAYQLALIADDSIIRVQATEIRDLVDVNAELRAMGDKSIRLLNAQKRHSFWTKIGVLGLVVIAVVTHG